MRSGRPSNELSNGGDYMVECCWRGALFYLLTARLSGFRTTPHGDMQGAAATSSSPQRSDVLARSNLLIFSRKLLSCCIPTTD